MSASVSEAASRRMNKRKAGGRKRNYDEGLDKLLTYLDLLEGQILERAWLVSQALRDLLPLGWFRWIRRTTIMRLYLSTIALVRRNVDLLLAVFGLGHQLPPFCVVGRRVFVYYGWSSQAI